MKIKDIKINNDSNWDLTVLDLVYPIGAIYVTTNLSTPSVLFGGTWENVGQNKLLFGASSTIAGNTTGGNANNAYQITSANLPKHTHILTAHAHTLNSHTHSIPAHAHGLNAHTHTYDKCTSMTNAGHTHNLYFGYSATSTGGNPSGADNMILQGWNATNSTWSNAVLDGSGTVLRNGDITNARQNDRTNRRYRTTSVSSSSTPKITIKHTSTDTTAASGNATTTSTVANSGASSGNTGNSNTANSADGGFANTAISLLPSYYTVYIWRRTA